MGGILKTPKAPEVPEVQEIPDPDDNLLKQRKRQEAAAQVASTGRQSTRLSERGGNTSLGA